MFCSNFFIKVMICCCFDVPLFSGYWLKVWKIWPCKASKKSYILFQGSYRHSANYIHTQVFIQNKTWIPPPKNKGNSNACRGKWLRVQAVINFVIFSLFSPYENLFLVFFPRWKRGQEIRGASLWITSLGGGFPSQI